MKIRFRCPQCNALLTAARDLQGLLLPCPKCKAEVQVPKRAGVCPNCGHPMEEQGRRWHFVLLAFAGFVAAMVWLGVLGWGDPGIPQGERISALLFSSAFALAMAALTCHFATQRVQECPRCDTLVLGKRLLFPDAPSAWRRCPKCDQPMRSANLVYRLRDVVLGLGFAAVLAWPLVNAYVMAMKAKAEALAAWGIFLFFAALAALGVWHAWRSLMSQHWRCRRCGIRAIVPHLPQPPAPPRA